MFKVQVVKDMRCHIESGHNFMLAKKMKETQQQQTILACNPRESFPDKTNNFPHVLMSGEIDIATKCVGRYGKKTKPKKTKIAFYANSLSKSFHHPCRSLFYGRDHLRSNLWGSFPVRDHLRSNLGIICGPGSFAVPGSFAEPYSNRCNRSGVRQGYRSPK